MSFNLVSKNNMGIFTTLILVILLSQSRLFNFLTDNHLGRMVLLTFIIFISYTSKFLGLLAVLFIIIGFNGHQFNTVYSYNYFEGFDVSGNTIDVSNTLIDMSANVLNNKKQAIVDMIKSTTVESTPATNNTTAQEGFCMPDRELNILRGKQSNTIPVYNKSREQTNDVDPSDKSVFSGDYAAF